MRRTTNGAFERKTTRTKTPALTNGHFSYEYNEQARVPHTNGPRDVPRCGALSLV